MKPRLSLYCALLLLTFLSIHCGNSGECETPNPGHDPTDPSSVACLASGPGTQLRQSGGQDGEVDIPEGDSAENASTGESTIESFLGQSGESSAPVVTIPSDDDGETDVNEGTMPDESRQGREVPALGPAEGQLLSTDGEESNHVAKGCNTYNNAQDGGDEAYGFCVDESADGVNYCNDVLGGESISGYCDGGPTRCCSNVACDAYNSMGVLATGICLGQVAPTQGGDAPPLPQCDGFIWMNSTCPNDNAVGSDGNVGCCMAPDAGPEY